MHRDINTCLKLRSVTVIGIDINKNNIAVALLSDNANRTASKVLEVLSRTGLKDYVINVAGIYTRELVIMKINFDHVKKAHCDACTALINDIARDRYVVVNMEYLDDLVLSGRCRLAAYSQLKSSILRRPRMFAIIDRPPVDIGYTSKISKVWSQLYLCYTHNGKYVTMLTEPYRTTLMCSRCLMMKNTVSLCRKVGRDVVCHEHGRIDRDENAAINMAELALRSLRSSTYKLVMSTPLPSTGSSSLPSPGAAGSSWRVGVTMLLVISPLSLTPAALGEGDGLYVEGRDYHKLAGSSGTAAGYGEAVSLGSPEKSPSPPLFTSCNKQ